MENQSENRILKVGALGVAAVVLFGASWWLINLLIFDHQPLVFWGWAILLMAASIAALAFFTLTASNSKWFWVINSVILANYLVIFPKDVYVILGGLVFFALGFWFERRVKAEENSRADFSIRRVMSASINPIIYGILFLLAANLYYNTSQEFKANPNAFYRKLGDSAAKNVDRINFNQTLEQYLVESRASHEDFRQILAQALTQRLREAVQPYERFFPLIFTIIIVALLRTFAFLFRWLTLLVTWIFYRILLSLRFFRIEKVPVEVNKLVI